MIAVGCPVKSRAWILPSWFHYVETAFARIGEEPYYVFVVGTSVDDTTEMIEHALEYHNGSVLYVEEPRQRAAQRVWNLERYEQMAATRNSLLGLVRELAPEYFLSVDSDILLNPQALVEMLETSERVSAVGGKVYLVEPPDLGAPSYCQFTSFNNMHRPDSDGVFPVDAIMALKLMKPEAYRIDYACHHHGEDLGWSLAAKEAGLTLMWDGRSTSKHVMSPEWLDRVDPRVGY